MLKKEEPYWHESEHMYEPPVHDPYRHRPMAKGPVYTTHLEPMDTKAHPSEQSHHTKLTYMNPHEGEDGN